MWRRLAGFPFIAISWQCHLHKIAMFRSCLRPSAVSSRAALAHPCLRIFLRLYFLHMLTLSRDGKAPFTAFDLSTLTPEIHVKIKMAKVFFLFPLAVFKAAFPTLCVLPWFNLSCY